MKVLYGLLVISVAALVASGIAMWWRLRRHLRNGDPVKEAAESLPAESETVEQQNSR
jgi:uncharacterized iron-regulated membrane protein